MSIAVTIGNFDGVHRGHRALVRAARVATGETGRVVAITFEPHPAETLRPGSAPPRLSTSAQRRQWLRSAGADEVIEIEPTRAFLGQSPREFIRHVVERWRPQAVVEGPDFCFGRGREGTLATLEALGGEFGYRTVVAPPIEVVLADQAVVRASSSLARWLIERGRVRDAEIVLGRPYELEAPVERGDQRGRLIGFPTANLAVSGQLLPADGVYAGVAEVEAGGVWPAAISVGTKPTFDGRQRLCEAHLVGWRGALDAYGWMIRVRFRAWLRDQVKYDSVEALVEQLHRDVERAAPAGMRT
jgi:riboflavin kinase / FMN adenylyltransferase